MLRPGEPVFAQDPEREDGQVGALGEGDEETKFLRSYRSEEQLEKGYRRGALILGLLAVILFLFGAVFVSVAAVAGLAVVAGAH